MKYKFMVHLWRRPKNLHWYDVLTNEHLYFALENVLQKTTA